ncbi:unnamed protein product [Schistocephalus solidus]|uniref:Type VI secretion system protein ImpL n=1 Tax=Schistocephalus solidus TaxID=70667 RepID=A0A183TTT4_SCHSO|nr:unnamed protein product [Schistocephalus solidus]
MAISGLLVIINQPNPNPGAAAPEARTRNLTGRSPTLYPLRHVLVILPVSIWNIDNGIGALSDRLQDSLVPLWLEAYSQALPAAIRQLPSHTQTQALQRKSLELANFTGSNPAFYPLRHELVDLPVSIGNIDKGNWRSLIGYRTHSSICALGLTLTPRQHP